MRGDRGSATLIGVAAIGAVLAITVGGFQIGSAVIARHRAQAAADLAALAAAARVPAGSDAACGQATTIANAMKVVVADCTVEHLDAVVIINAGRARAGARAGTTDATT